jgi:branched-chain amino acid transport system permease protein
MIGGLILGEAEVLIVAISPQHFGSAYIDIVSFAVLIGILLVRPTGLLGERLGRAA